LAEGNIRDTAAVRTQGRGTASIGLDGVRRKAQQDKEFICTSLSESEISAFVPEVGMKGGTGLKFRHLFHTKNGKKPKLVKGLSGMYSLKRLSENIG